MTIKYRICWKAKTTKAQGEGEFIYTNKEIAEHRAKELDQKLPGLIHWVEPQRS